MITTDQLVAERLLYLSALRRGSLLDRRGERLGRVDDVIVRLVEEGHPPLTGLKARIGGREVFVPLGLVAALEDGRVRLAGEKLSLGRFERREGEVLLVADVLGHSLVHVAADPPRLVRAQELVLAGEGDSWRLVGIETGSAARLRRLLPRRLRPWIRPRPPIDWAELDPFVAHVPTMRRRLRHRKLARLHPAEIADLVEAASAEEGEEIMSSLKANRELEADVFEELEPTHQLELLEERPDEEVAAMVARMEPDDAADLIEQLQQSRRAKVLALLPAPQRRQVQRLLGYNPSTAGGLMSPEVLLVDGGRTVEEALEQVRRAELASEAALIACVHDEEGRLQGTVDAVTLLRADPRSRVDGLLKGEAVAVPTDADVTLVARLMADYDLILLPVVDASNRVVGGISVDDVLEQTLPSGWRRRYGAARE